jgi:hypothetical protein
LVFVEYNTPTITASSSSNTICINSNATLTASGASTYTWNPGNLSGNNVVVSPTISTTYTLAGTSQTTGCSSNTTFLQIVSTCASISELNYEKNTIVIFPNPANNTISLFTDYEFKDLVIINGLGQVVSTVTQQKMINIESLSSGIYFIKLYDDNKLITTKKFIKE